MNITINHAPIGTRVSVMDLVGKILFTETIQEDIHTLSTISLANGIYIVQLENHNQISRRKLVINK